MHRNHLHLRTRIFPARASQADRRFIELDCCHYLEKAVAEKASQISIPLLASMLASYVTETLLKGLDIQGVRQLR